jgi:hypothetical protein
MNADDFSFDQLDDEAFQPVNPPHLRCRAWTALTPYPNAGHKSAIIAVISVNLCASL